MLCERIASQSEVIRAILLEDSPRSILPSSNLPLKSTAFKHKNNWCVSESHLGVLTPPGSPTDCTAYHLACRYDSPGVLRVLAAAVNVPPELKARTPAHAKQLGWHVEFESRVAQGCDMQARNKAGQTGWEWAEQVGSTAVRRCLCLAFPLPFALCFHCLRG